MNFYGGVYLGGRGLEIRMSEMGPRRKVPLGVASTVCVKRFAV